MPWMLLESTDGIPLDAAPPAHPGHKTASAPPEWAELNNYRRLQRVQEGDLSPSTTRFTLTTSDLLGQHHLVLEI